MTHRHNKRDPDRYRIIAATVHRCTIVVDQCSAIGPTIENRELVARVICAKRALQRAA